MDSKFIKICKGRNKAFKAIKKHALNTLKFTSLVIPSYDPDFEEKPKATVKTILDCLDYFECQDISEKRVTDSKGKYLLSDKVFYFSGCIDGITEITETIIKSAENVLYGGISYQIKSFRAVTQFFNGVTLWEIVAGGIK